ncbi:MAG: HigA family addiction module antidote protein [Magnetococcales bacterium]|nr:HigA family addiction module antidote protein [Magnetococcales bacterium]
MNDSTKNRYVPDYLVTPGEVLGEYLQAHSMTQTQLAMRAGLTPKTINEIIKGIAPITHETAIRFERILGRPAHFWNNLESQYQEDRLRLAERERLQAALAWLQRVPVKKMIEFGWLSAHEDKTSQLEAVLRFFGIASPDQWSAVWENYQVAYRQSQRFATNPEAVSAWLRQGEIAAQQLDCASFDKKVFHQTLSNIRSLTTMTIEEFQPKLIEQCAAAGVAVVLVPELPKTGVSGATRWLGKRAVIQLSLRYKSNDHFWFTFFHEAGHIVKHGKEIFIESNGLDGEKEEEANTFAQNWLIPPSALHRFLQQWDRHSLDPIIRFAGEIGIAPGIVVGRLQHDALLEPQTGNKLKVFYYFNSVDVA